MGTGYRSRSFFVAVFIIHIKKEEQICGIIKTVISMQYEVRKIKCVSACNRVKSGVPYLWDMNAYRGCGHSCRYCFALYTHRYMRSDDFFNEIYVKINIAESLEKLLRSKSWKGEPINLGGVTDNYQPLEKEYELMPDIWKLLIKYKNPCTISTKSDLILRDFDLIAELAETAYVNVASTITGIDEAVREKLEPGAVSYERRFAMLKAFKQTKASTGLHIMPVIPYLTDTDENLEGLFERGKDAGVNYAIVQALNLRGETKNVFMSFIKKEYPQLYIPLLDMYKTGYAPKEYRAELARRAAGFMRKNGIGADYSEIMRARRSKEEYTQLSLFD